ncbi:MAG: hypothetical protein A3G35_01725 [candidate division NC10 bacterium RIFCSPLOWO2_12_FULL_66_18]|nr:MAG: hypothetical protein A3G35_01725 [candidate division NC10 bacterium RIFCSPLOWO2_12_FULL_66_18]
MLERKGLITRGEVLEVIKRLQKRTPKAGYIGSNGGRRSVLARGVLPAEVAPVPARGAPAIDKSLRPRVKEQV